MLWRRSATAVGTYASVVLGVLGTLAAARALSPADFGRFAIVLVAASFFQVLLDVTVEEAVIKFGFRYSATEDWGRLHRLFRRVLALKGIGGVLAGFALLGLAPLSARVFGAGHLATPLLVVALLPLVQAPESLAGVALVLRGRYDVRAFFLFVSQALRLAAIVVGARYGVTQLVVAIVVGQALASAAVGTVGWLAFRRFPRVAPEELGSDRSQIVRFVLQSSVATGIVSLRGTLGTLLLGVVTNPLQVGYFRIAQAPQVGFAALSSPARLILLTEQTRDWERGARERVFRGVRRYMLGALLLMAPIVPLALWWMPALIRALYKAKYLPATDAARIILLAAALQLVFGWTKSFPVSVGRPALRILVYGLESVVLIPLVIVLGRRYGATGGAGAIVAATAASSLLWGLILVRMARDERAAVRIAAKALPGEALNP